MTRDQDDKSCENDNGNTLPPPPAYDSICQSEKYLAIEQMILKRINETEVGGMPDEGK